MTRLAQASTTKCQIMQGNTKIIRIVREGNVCFREVIDVLKGKKTRASVSCSAQCG